MTCPQSPDAYINITHMKIETFDTNHLDAVIRLSLRAWEPVFDSLQSIIDSEVYQEFYPQGWRLSQQQAVEQVCAEEHSHVWVAIEDSLTVGFVAIRLHTESKMGEIYMIAVDPDYQGRGIATALTDFSLEWMRAAGMTIAMVETGGDSGHAPARRTYEKAGFGLLPLARYFKKL
jgi:ribosomal protein S18 acetylase RimI-like enzyme